MRTRSEQGELASPLRLLEMLEFRDDLKQAYRAALEWARATGMDVGPDSDFDE